MEAFSEDEGQNSLHLVYGFVEFAIQLRVETIKALVYCNCFIFRLELQSIFGSMIDYLPALSLPVQ